MLIWPPLTRARSDRCILCAHCAHAGQPMSARCNKCVRKIAKYYHLSEHLLRFDARWHGFASLAAKINDIYSVVRVVLTAGMVIVHATGCQCSRLVLDPRQAQRLTCCFCALLIQHIDIAPDNLIPC